MLPLTTTETTPQDLAEDMTMTTMDNDVIHLNNSQQTYFGQFPIKNNFSHTCIIIQLLQYLQT